MNYGEVKTQFTALLNRRDITPSLVDTFLGFGVQRIQREIRVPAMEKVVEVQTDGTDAITVPGDLLEVISISTNDSVNQNKLIRTDLQTIIRTARVIGIPKYYYRNASPFRFHLGPCPPEDTSIYIHYYADAGNLGSDSDQNWLTMIAPTMLIYAALSYAADYYLDDRKEMFEASYGQIAGQLVLQAQQDELSNASISPAYQME